MAYLSQSWCLSVTTSYGNNLYWSSLCTRHCAGGSWVNFKCFLIALWLAKVKVILNQNLCICLYWGKCKGCASRLCRTLESPGELLKLVVPESHLLCSHLIGLGYHLDIDIFFKVPLLKWMVGAGKVTNYAQIASWRQVIRIISSNDVTFWRSSWPSPPAGFQTGQWGRKEPRKGWSRDLGSRPVSAAHLKKWLILTYMLWI